MSDAHLAVELIDDLGRRTLDVSKLPTTVQGPRSPVWWGNTLLMLIESTSVVLLIAAYLYMRQNFASWPPPNPNHTPPLERALPDLPLPSIELGVMLASSVLMSWTNSAARKLDKRRTTLGLGALLIITLALIAARFVEFHGLNVRWDDNAYGSIVWTLLGLHLTYLLAAAGEFLIMVLWIHRCGLDDHHAHDVVLTGIFWHWTVATWAILFTVVYVGARVL